MTALRLVFHGVRGACARRTPAIEAVAAAAVAAAFCALVLHTFVYAAFLEDPLSWTLLALAGALAARAPAAVAAVPRARRRPGRSSEPASYPGPVPSRKVTIVAAVILALGAAGAAAAYFLVLKEPGDISNPDVPFIDAEPTPGPKAKKAKPPKPNKFRWPRYGFTKDHNRNFDPAKPIRGPFRAKWKHKASALTEFPPAISQGRILQLSDDARLVSRELESGKKRWKRNLGSLSASTPAIDDGRIYVTLLETSKGSGNGRIVCLRFGDGKILWSKTLSSRSESSPLVHNGRVFFGSEGGTLYALDGRSGKQDWTYRAGGAIKGSPTLSDDGLLYFGAYGGSVHAVRARDGAKIWSKSASGGLRGGNFYATAAVAYGRVYIGATDGRAYSLSAKDGRIAWAHQTGRYVYSSAAVKNVPGRGPMVFFGSYDGTFYALDAKLGQGPLDPPLRRQDLRLADDRRRRRLLRGPRQGGDRRAQDRQRQGRLQVPDRRL